MEPAVDVHSRYRVLISPLAQLEVTHEVVAQIQALVADTWRESEDPDRRQAHEDAAEFLDEWEPWETFRDVLEALAVTGLRFEIDSEWMAGGVDGYFNHDNRGRPLDRVLHNLAVKFNSAITEVLDVGGWRLDDTLACLAWENLVLVPDEDRSVAKALALLNLGAPGA